MSKFISLLLLLPYLAFAIEYPEVKRDETIVDDYYGVKVKDPYRALENQNSIEVKEFIKSQNQVTNNYINKPIRENILKKLTETYNYTTFTIPVKHGDRYYFFKNSGLQNQEVLHYQDSLESTGKVFFDPNSLSEDGSTAVYQTKFSKDGTLFLYSLSKLGSDWLSVHIKNVTSGEEFPEVLYQVKWSFFEWTHDNEGFIYPRYLSHDQNAPVGTDTALLSNQKLYYHKVGTPQSQDLLIAEFPASWEFTSGKITEDGKHIIMTLDIGGGVPVGYFASLLESFKNNGSKLRTRPFLEEKVFKFEYVTSNGNTVYMLTSEDAPNGKIVSFDLEKPDKPCWTIIPENKDFKLKQARQYHMLVYVDKAKQLRMELRFLENGSFIQTFPLEDGVAITKLIGERSDNEFFFELNSFLTPGKIFRVDLSNKTLDTFEAKIYQKIKANGVVYNDFVQKRVFFTGNDGMKVPMFIAHKKDYIPQSISPTFVADGFYAYSVPRFNPQAIAFVQNFDGVFAIPYIRGGYFPTEYNNTKRSYSVEDFQAAVEYLISENYTVPSKIVIEGFVQGAVTVVASMNTRPELYGAFIGDVGVYDMLRTHLFTMGCATFGCVTDGKESFENLYKISPLHNVRVPETDGVQYPAVLLFTGENNDRTNPLLIKVQVDFGHGYSKPRSLRIAESTDIFVFLVEALGFTFTT